MTVRRQAGDAGGDLATQSPATGPPLWDLSSSGALRCGPATSKESEERPSALSSVVPVEVAGYSSERSFGSRFWALQPGEEGNESDDEELGESGDEDSPVREGVSLASYLCRTPSPSQNADLSEDTAELNQRHMKRLWRRDAQRLATRAAIFFSSSADMLNRVATPGLVSSGSSALSRQPAMGQDRPAAATGTHGACGGPPAGRQLDAAAAVATPRDTSGAAVSPHAAAKPLAGSLQTVASGRAVAEAGLSAPGRSTTPVAGKHIAPQKIQAVAASQPELRASREVNQMPMIGAMHDGLAVQHSARVLGVPDGVGSGGSLEQSKGRTTADVLAMAKGVGLCATKEAMGVASSSVHVVLTTTEEVIAFGGIPKPPIGVRSSTRLAGQPDGDMLQMDKAMRIAQSRDASGVGYPYGVTLGPVVGSSVTGWTAGCYGYWMHTAPDGRSGYLVPGWLASH